MALSPDDAPLVPDEEGGGFSVIDLAQSRTAIREFELVRTGEYFRLHNPHTQHTDNYPNGTYNSARNELNPGSLAMGKVRVVSKGCFPLWPGQWVERLEVHRLRSDEYLIAQVEDAEAIDINAPYFRLTLECARQAHAIEVGLSVSSPGGAENRADGDSSTEDAVPPQGGEAASLEERDDWKRLLTTGTLIRIKGSEEYIPPTGIKVIVHEESRFAKHDPFEDECEDADDEDSANDGRGAADPAVCRAPVLSPAEFCILVNPDGQPSVVRGPKRVFPGPYDTFMSKGSRNRVYDAYQLRNDRALLIRVINDLAREDLYKQLPAGVDLSQEPAHLRAGQELVIKGVDGFLFPSTDFVVLVPSTREVHTGNDHDNVFIESIAVDGLSGIYVERIDTGAVETRRGEASILLDPRRERQRTRRVPQKEWNLWIRGKETDHSIVATPWAVSISVNPGEACLAVSADSSRVIEGPATAVLDWKEALYTLNLSTGKKKTTDRLQPVCFLRTKGNRVSDTITVRTSDNVTVHISVAYYVDFVGYPEEKAKWFMENNYVGLLTSRLAAKVQAAAERLPIAEVFAKTTQLVRSVVLKEPAEVTATSRPGTLFSENNMFVYEVDVSEPKIDDPSVNETLRRSLQTAATLAIQNTTAEIQLEAERAANARRKELQAIQLATVELERDLKLTKVNADKAVEKQTAENLAALKTVAWEAEDSLRKAKDAYANAQAEDLRNRKREDTMAALDGLQAEHEEAERHATQLAKVETERVASQAEADAKVLEAIAPKLVEALTGLGDKQALADLCKNVPQMGGLLGGLFTQPGVEGLASLLGNNSRLSAALNALLKTPAGD
jgi:hypothetical protein